MGESTKIKRAKCSKCKGTGKIIVKKVERGCTHCNGFGEVFAP